MDQREAQLEVRERSLAVRTSVNARRNAAAGSERKYDSDARSRSATFPGVADGPDTTPKPEPSHLSYAVLSLVAFVWFDELTFTCHAAPPQLIVEHLFQSRGCSPGVFPSTRRSSSLRHICKPGAASPSSPTFVRCASWATSTQKIGEIRGQIRVKRENGPF